MLLISFAAKIRDGGSFYIFDFDNEAGQNTAESYRPQRSNDISSNTRKDETNSDRVDNSTNTNSTDVIKKNEDGEAIFDEWLEIAKINKEIIDRNKEIIDRNQDRINGKDNSPLESLEKLESSPDNEFLRALGESKLISLPKSGYSPYDSYFGKGVYNNSADNYIKVTAPISYHIVFLLKDVYSKRTIRNEFIRKGSTFNLTGIPYGTYEFSYFSGDDWSDQQEMKNGEIKGGFTKNKSFSKSEQYKDRMEFRSDEYGGYEIELISTVSGNLSTQTSNEDESFN